MLTHEQQNEIQWLRYFFLQAILQAFLVGMMGEFLHRVHCRWYVVVLFVLNVVLLILCTIAFFHSYRNLKNDR